MQMPVVRIFAEFGEARFRQLEHDAVEEALSGPASVIVPGGGWAAGEGHIAGARGRAYIIYLKVEPSTAAARIPADHDRPLLLGQDPVVRMQELLRNRQAFYELADKVIPNDKATAEQTAGEIGKLARQFAGW
jgi:shikimate kinase